MKNVSAITAAIVAAVVLGWVYMRNGDSSVVLDEVPSHAPRPGTGEAASAASKDPRSAGPVRVLLRSAPDAAQLPQGQFSDDGGDELVGEYEHLGPVDARVMESLLGTCAEQLRKLEGRLAAQRDGASSTVLLEEADMLLRLVTLNREMDALRSGAYITTRPGEPRPPLNIPGAEVVSTGGLVGGDYVELTFIFPLASDPQLRAARDYRAAMAEFDQSEKARRFNALPDVERMDLARRLGEILRKPHRSQEENELLFDTIGWNARLDEATGIVSVRPR